MNKKFTLAFLGLFIYGITISQTYFTEDFEAAFTGSPAVPPGWTRTNFDAVNNTYNVGSAATGNKEWFRREWSGSAWLPYSTGTVPTGAVSGVGVLSIEDYWWGTPAGAYCKRLESPSINLSGSTSPYLSFWYFCAQEPMQNFNLKILMSSDGGTSWNYVNSVLAGFDSTAANQWNLIRIRIPSVFHTSSFKFAFELTNRYGTNDPFIDLVRVEEFTPPTITSVTSGNWNAAATWNLGRVPRSGDNVVVASGHTVTINSGLTAGLGARCNNLTINGTLTFSSTTSSALHVHGNLTINSGGTFNPFNGTSGRTVIVGGNVTISSGGTYNGDVSTTAATSTTLFPTGASTLVFNGFESSTFTNSGTLTNGRIRNLIVIKNDGASVNFAFPVNIPLTLGIINGDLNANNITLGASSVSTTQTILRNRGKVVNAFTWGTGVTRSYQYISPTYGLQRQELIYTGPEIEPVGGIRTVNPGGTFTMNTHNNIELSEDLQLGTGTATAATLTLTRGIIRTGNFRLIWNTTSTTGPSAGTTPSTSSPPTTHGSYVVGNFKIRFQTSGTTSRTVPLGIGSDFNSLTAPTANRYTPVTFGNTSGWPSSAPFPVVSWVNSPSGATNPPLTTLFTARALRVDLDGGNDFNATTTITLNANNYTFGGGTSSDNLSAGDVSQLRLAQSTSLTGPWTQRTTASGTGPFAANTNYTRTTATGAPGPIAPLATNGEYFAWASTVPNLDMGAIALVSPPPAGCYGTNQTLTVRIRNFASNTINFASDPVTVGALVSGPIPASPFVVVNSGTLAPGDSLNVTVTTTLDMSGFGTYTFTPYAIVAGDGNNANDSLSPKPTRTLSAPVSLPTTLLTFTGFTGANLNTVFPGWNEGQGAITPTITNSLWTSQTGVTGASGTTARINLWVNTRNEWLFGPKVTAGSCTEFRFRAAITDFAATTIPDPEGMTGTDDSVTVMVSTDCGVTWQRVFAVTASNAPPAGVISWVSYSVPLSSFAGQDIIVALKATDGPTDDLPDYDFHVDDLQVRNRPAVDISAEAITLPVPGGTTPNGNASQQIKVRIRNTGCNTISFSSNPTTITINVTGATTTSRNVTVSSGSLAPNDTLIVDVGAPFNMSNTGTYNFSGFAITTGDGFASNDTFPTTAHEVSQGWNIRYATGVTYSSIMATGTSFTNWVNGTNTDDNTSGIVRLFNLTPPFDFDFYGVKVPAFRACTNGWITFDSTVTLTTFTNDLALSSLNRILAPFWDDLRTNGHPGTLTSLDTSMKYQILGNAPNRVLVVEWKNMESFSNPNGTDLSFQIRLYENGDSIEYVYGRMQGFDGSTNFTWSYSLGLKGTNTNAQRQSQQVANSRQFVNTAVNNLTELPACYSRLSFIPFDNCIGCTASTAPPSNDNVAGAISIPVNNEPCVDLCGTYYRSRFATASPQPVCTATADDDVWFVFTAPNPLQGNIKIDVRGAGGYDPVLEVLDASLTSIRCRNATGVGLTDTAVILESNLIPGGTYYARVYHAGSGSGTDGNFSICVYNQPVPPVNDTVGGAINLTVGSSCVPITGNTLSATGSKNPACTGVPDDDLWYRFTATSPNITIQVQSGAGFNAVLQVFDSISTPLSSGDTLPRNSIACINNTGTGGLETFTSSSLVVGRTYYIRVYHFPLGAATGQFTICAFIPPKTLGTITATQQTGDVPQGATNALVVRYNLPVTGFAGTLTLTSATITSNNTLDSDIAPGGVLLYSTGANATFTSPTLLGSGTFSGGTLTLTGLNLDLNTGNNYIWIAYNISPSAVDGDSVDAFFAAGSLSITAAGGAVAPGVQPPSNLNPVGRRRIFIPNPHDDCAGAKPLVICGVPDTIKNLHRTSQSIPAGPCGGTADDDIWYKFTTTSSDTVFITVFSTLDVVFEVRLGPGCNGTYIGCIDDNFSSGFEEGILTGVSPGQTYYIRVYSWTATPPSPTAYTWAHVGPGGCWLGIFNNSWANAGNWGNFSVPNSCAANVIIPAGTPFQPTISGANYTVGNVNISSGVTLTLAGNNLNVCGNWTGGSGTDAVVSGTGRVELIGTGAQSISGNSLFNTLRVNKSSGTASLASGADVDIRNALELQNGNLNVTAGTITFKSPSVDTIAMLDNFSPGFNGTITGNIRAERAYAAATASPLYKQHYFSSPVNNVPFSQFAPLFGADGVPVTPKANCDETELEAGSNYGNVFEYDESNVTSCYLQAWRVRSAGNAQNARGYSVVKGTAGVLTLTGAPNLGNYSISGLNNSGWSSSTLQGNTYQGGWHLLGNPYLASLDLNASANSAFDDNVLVLHTHGTFAGTYQPVSMSSTAVLPPFQGFFARKTIIGGSPATFTISNTDRRRTAATFHKADEHQMSLMVEGNGFADITYFNFNEDATNGYDPQYDGGKFASFLEQPTLYSLIGSVWASVNTNKNVESTPSIPVGFKPGKNGTFRFVATGFDALPNTTVYLEDKKTNTLHNLTNIPEYTFTANVNDIQERFLLRFSVETPSSVINAENNLIKIFSHENKVIVDFTKAVSGTHNIVLYDILGREISNENFTGKIYSKLLDIEEPMYVIVKTNDGNKIISKKVFLTK
ncbi:MAG: G8 domain-containing protein [Chitinophagales bacterium]|nr:G8 domain-containing protein [Chitinophagales bacterium]